MDDYEYNPDDFQGRKQSQVEASYKAIVWAGIIGIILIVVGQLIQVLK